MLMTELKRAMPVAAVNSVVHLSMFRQIIGPTPGLLR